MLTIRPLSHDRIPTLAATLCIADRAELDAAGIADAEAMLREAVPWCLWADEALWDGRPVAVFGVRPTPDFGVPWMLTTSHMPDAEKAAIAMAARKAVRRMRAEFPRLCNLVHRKNERAIRFIKALKFRVHEEPRGPKGDFYLFEWERACAIQ